MKKLYFPSFLKFEAIKANHTPEILINDPRTGDAVRSDFRTVLLNYLSDISGEPATDAVGYFEVTLAELQNLESTSAVQPGYFYYITDRDILLQGVGVDKVSLHGAYYVKVGVGVNEVDYVEFDVTNDIMLRRRDKRGNDVALSKEYLDSAGLPYTTIDEFYWLNNLVYGNTIVDSYVTLDDGVNQYGGTFRNNTIVGRSVVDLSTVSLVTATFSANFLNASSFTVASDPSTTCSIYNNTLESSSVLEYTTFGFQFYNNSLSEDTSYYSYAAHSNTIFAWNNLSSDTTLTISDTGMTSTRALTIVRNTIAGGSTLTINYSDSSLTTLSYSTISNGSTVTLTNVANTVIRLIVDDFSTFSLSSTSGVSLQFTDIRVTERSSFTISSFTSNITVSEITVTNSSTFSASATAGSFNNIFISENSAVTLSGNTTNKSNIVIKRWTVTLYGGAATTTAINFTLDISMDSSFSPVYRSSLVQFLYYDSAHPSGYGRVAANVFSFSATSHDAYTGVFFMVDTGGNTISSFANTTFILDQVAISFQADIGETLIFAQDPAPVASGGIGMNVASITLNGQDGNVTGDTLTLQKSPNERFVVMSHFYTT